MARVGTGGDGAASKRPARETVHPSTSQSFFFRHQITDRYRFPWHQHSELELTLVLRGRGQRFVGDDVGNVVAPEVTLIGAQTPHTWVYDDATAPVETIVVQFLPELFGSRLPEYRELIGLFARARYGLLLHGLVRKQVTAELQALVVSTDPLERFARLSMILAHIAAAQDTKDTVVLSHTALDAQPDSRLAQVINHLQSQVSSGVTPRDLADIAGMHPAAFSRWFHQRLGKTCVQYLAEVRISLACRKLLEDAGSIVDIGLACGFDTSTSFNRWFRRLRGITPSAYRASAGRVGRD